LPFQFLTATPTTPLTTPETRSGRWTVAAITDLSRGRESNKPRQRLCSERRAPKDILRVVLESRLLVSVEERRTSTRRSREDQSFQPFRQELPSLTVSEEARYDVVYDSVPIHGIKRISSSVQILLKCQVIELTKHESP
jgi:hypothetical protein